MLEIVTDVVEHLEDAGDEMGNAFGAYQLGRRSYSGGGNIARLIQAVISFLNRWRTGKERFEQLSARQEALRASLEGNAKQLSVLPESSQEMADGQDR